jgi:hypothetical protein
MLGRFVGFPKYLGLFVLTVCVVTPNLVKANQIAQGYVQVNIEALSAPQAITDASCGVSLSTFDAGAVYSNDVSIEATPVSNVVNCIVVVPYYWSLTALTGSINIGYSIGGQNGTVVTKNAGGNFNPIPVTTTGTTILYVSTVF